MGRNRLVMIVDEDADFRAQLSDLLKPAAVAVVAECGYGAEASRLAEETQPDLILAAIEEPIDEAIETIASIRQALRDVPVIAYTSIGDMAALRPVLQLGVSDLLTHPIDERDLLQTVQEALNDSPEAGGTVREQAKVITIVGAKGGVGKSTIATNLAAAIVRDTEYSVLVMDLDTRFGDVAFMLDIEPTFTIADLAAELDALDRTTFQSALLTHDSGVLVLPAPRHPAQWTNISGEQVKELIAFASGMFDYVILDTPGTFNDIVATALDVASEVFVVSSLDLASVKDTVYMLDLLQSEGYPSERLRLVVNDATNATMIKAADAAAVFNREMDWEIPYDREVSRAAHAGQPVVLAKPKSKAARGFALVARDVTGQGRRSSPPEPGRKLIWTIPMPRLGRGARKGGEHAA